MTEEKKLIGFARMIVENPEKFKEIASKGGKAAMIPGGKGHRFTPEETKAASRRAIEIRRAKMAELRRLQEKESA